MHIGGGKSGEKGIHSWHVDPDKRTTYVAADPQRQEIVRVRVDKSDGTVEEFAADGAEGAAGEQPYRETRVMDCIDDCHNRPTHTFQTPAEAMDKALIWGRIDRALPYVKKLGVEVLTEAKGNPGDLDKIAQRVRSYYQENYADRFAADHDGMEAAIREIQAIHNRNVFPDMKVTWGTYTMNIGHDDEVSKRCFRCHDDHLVDKEGKSIGQDCDACHAVLAWDEENPEVLQQLNLQ